MLQSKLKIINKLGLHARASAKFVAVTGSSGASIRVHFNGRSADGKSIMAIMMMGIRQGSELQIDVDGDGAAELIEALTTLVDNRFGEDE